MLAWANLVCSYKTSFHSFLLHMQAMTDRPSYCCLDRLHKQSHCTQQDIASQATMGLGDKGQLQ